MDIFKLLSRSTKATNKPSASNASKLPSSGSPANPQLYHDPVSESRGTKRKRGDAKKEETYDQPSNEDINFFATKTEKKKSGKEALVLDQAKFDSKIVSIGAKPNIPDEDECRQILRSHRVKVMLLPSLGAAKVLKSRPKKSKKGKREEVAPAKKEEPKQIFPQPLQAFQDLQSIYGISKRLSENLATQGYQIPTEVQMGSLPLLLQPNVALGPSLDETDRAPKCSEIDLLAVAPTGSGKTLAFLIPVINSMVQRRREIGQHQSHRLEAIIVAPTKELASQIVNEGRKLALGTGIKVVGMQKGMQVVDGVEGVDQPESTSSSEEGSDAAEEEEEEEDDEEEEDKASRKGSKTKKRAAQPTAKSDILVTTPLVLLHALSKLSSSERSPLPTVRHLVLDEADVLLDPLFREQTIGIWDACINPDLHITLWSATMGSNIEALASETIQKRRERLSLTQPSTVVRLVVGLKDSAIPNISHKLIYTATEPGKLLGLRQLLHPVAQSSSSPGLRPPFLIFTQTIPRAIALHSELLYDIPAEAGGSTRIAVLHSDLSDSIRSSIMARFRNGEIWILITTDILSRGVDFRGINGVVNYDVPNSGAAYIHRVGRTGRAGRDGGVAVTFYTKEDIPYVKNIANIIAASEKQAGKEPSEAGMQKWLLDALPKPSKKDKKNLKMHGVEARRSNAVGTKGMISTKSGFERKVENRKRGAIEGSRRRKYEEKDEKVTAAEESEWGGIDE